MNIEQRQIDIIERRIKEWYGLSFEMEMIGKLPNGDFVVFGNFQSRKNNTTFVLINAETYLISSPIKMISISRSK